MDNKSTDPETTAPEIAFSMKDLDEETIALLIEDKIATGG
jgi:hypothetical protein